MTPASMREKFRTKANDLDLELGDPDIDTYLNRAYRFVISPDLGGEWNKGIWELAATAGVSTFSPDTFDMSQVFAVGNELTAWIRDGNGLHFLTVETDPARWELIFAGDPAQQARPRNMLLYGDSVTLWPTPDAAYTIEIPSITGPGHDFTSTEGEATLRDDRHAMAVVQAALLEYFDDVEDEVGYAKAAREYKRWRRLLGRTAHGRPNKRHQARSY